MYTYTFTCIYMNTHTHAVHTSDFQEMQSMFQQYVEEYDDIEPQGKSRIPLYTCG